MLGVSGGSGSGKTTFIKRLRDYFTDDQLCILSQDDYYKPRELQKKDKQGITNFDLPECIHDDELFADIQKLAQGEIVQRKEYVFNNELATPAMLEFRPAPILLVEGLFIFHFQQIKELLDLTIFLHAKDNLKVIRRIKRDQIERNYPIDDVLYRYENHVLPTFEKYIKPYQEDVDIVINNNKHFEMGLEVIKGFLSNWLTTHA